MTRVISFYILCFISSPAFSQIDYSGSYGYSSKVVIDPKSEWKPKGKEINQGPSGWLTLLKIANNQYKFWLSVSKGWPNYHSGDIDGILEAKGNNGVFKRKLDYNDSPCILFLHFFSKYIAIEQQGSDSDCGFGAFVYVDGNCKRRNSHKITTDEFNKLYNASFYTIAVAKTFVFKDSSGTKRKNQYFILNDKVLTTEENDNFIYIEHLTKSGKFINGWLRKTDVNPF